MESVLNRRDAVKVLGAVAFTALQLPAADPSAPLYFTKQEFALLDTLTDLLIPTDEHSPGAHASGVAGYIDRTVAEAFAPEDKTSWRKGLHSIDELSNQMHQCPFLRASKDQQTSLMAKIAAAEQNPQTEPEKFFTQLKQTTAFVYYSSSIGIHEETEYKGNVILQEFVGYDAT
ncbi:MAG: gluconate 2-dehydrogenase subunit 3 family protein [Acidobacteriaceae bacterium]|nr:gluconate 2-dehydrogenase subunit 3 family protein [Acidobacteriaceae bacterium]